MMGGMKTTIGDVMMIANWETIDLWTVKTSFPCTHVRVRYD